MNYLIALIAALRVLWLGSKVSGDFEILSVTKVEGKVYIHLPVNADTESFAKQSLFWNSRKGHALVQRAPDGEHNQRVFEVLQNYGQEPIPTKGAWLSGWLGDEPEHFDLQGGTFIALSNGTRAFQDLGNSKRWVIHVHGRKATYAETVRNFEQFKEFGYNQLAISHETDAKPFGLGQGISHLGDTEWQQVQIAVEYAKSQGAESVLLFGWSLGGLFVNEYLDRVSEAKIISGVILDSPLLDYRSTLQLQAGRAGLERSIVDLIMRIITRSRLLRLLGFKNVNIAALSALLHPRRHQVPTLLLHSSNDGYIAMNGVYRYQELNPKTRLVEIPGARHCRLFNEDQAKYQEAIRRFLTSNQI
jgi:alpha-beta hydrolase superfamily lysophospholipase